MKSKLIQFAFSLAFLTGLVSCAGLISGESKKSLNAQVKVPQAEANKIAIARFPNGRINEVELERENGLLVWSYEFLVPKTKNIREIQVDAKSGKIVSDEIETPEDQAKEAAEDRRK